MTKVWLFPVRRGTFALPKRVGIWNFLSQIQRTLVFNRSSILSLSFWEARQKLKQKLTIRQRAKFLDSREKFKPPASISESVVILQQCDVSREIKVWFTIWYCLWWTKLLSAFTPSTHQTFHQEIWTANSLQPKNSPCPCSEGLNCWFCRKN